MNSKPSHLLSISVASITLVGCIIFIYACDKYPPHPTNLSSASLCGLFHRRIIDSEDRLVDLHTAPRAIVFVDAPYSIYAANNGKKFVQGMSLVARRLPHLNVRAFWVSDDSEPWCQEWIKSFGVDDLMRLALPVGDGAVLWIERGEVVHYWFGDEPGDANSVFNTTTKLWSPQPSQVN